jgi:hypothetical protein
MCRHETSAAPQPGLSLGSSGVRINAGFNSLDAHQQIGAGIWIVAVSRQCGSMTRRRDSAGSMLELDDLKGLRGLVPHQCVEA